MVLFFKYHKTGTTNKIGDEGLVANLKGDELIQDIVNKDTDTDGVLDWEESLWGTDPKNKDTKGDGLGDKAEIEKLKKENGTADEDTSSTEGTKTTKTDQFSQELFATVSALNQSGQMDQATIDKLTDSIASKVANTAIRKSFGVNDIKIINDNTKEAALKYNDALSALYKKYPLKGSVLDILSKLSGDEEKVDEGVLASLDPIIKQTGLFMDGMTRINTPAFLTTQHLNFINVLERLVENMQDIKYFNSDVIVALGGMTQYQQNSEDLETVITNLQNAISNKLNN